MKNTVIYYNTPASEWTQALPVGNGRLGAMVFGGVSKEKLQLNEETLWSGFFEPDAELSDCSKKLGEMRSLLFEGEISKAESLASEYLICKPGHGSLRYEGKPYSYGSYQTAGDFYIKLSHGDDVKNYKRSLDISCGKAFVEYTSGDQKFTREVFASIPKRVIAVRLASDGAFDCAFSYERRGALISLSDDTISICGRLDAISYSLSIRIVSDGGLHKNGGEITLTGASYCEIYISIATTYRNNGDPTKITLDAVNDAVNITWDKLCRDSYNTFSCLIGRAEIDLGGKASELPVDERLARLRTGELEESDLLALISTYWQFGRYLSVSSSYNCELPANLQGIWAEDYEAKWSADYHININIQMNYWLSELTDLSECSEVFLRYVAFLAENGKRTAQKQYGCRGWVAHTVTNPWGFTAPGDEVEWGSFMCAGAWCCAQIWEHWLHSGDVEFLREYYPILRGACEFFLDFLCEDPTTGYLVTAPSNSPENHYRDPLTQKTVAVCAGPTMDNSILYELFTNTSEAAKILGVDNIFAKEILSTRDRLPPLKVGKHGQIMEWQEDYDETEPGHRHLSMLYALHPGCRITRTATPELFEAARVSLNRRLSSGGGHTGWSRAWIINFYARLGMGEDCQKHICALLEKSTYTNLFDSHPPFQIDGNFGAVAGITEMLIQSHDGFVELLPALPTCWKNGSFRGLCARGGFVFSAQWSDRALTSLSVESRLGGSVTLKIGGKEYKLNTNKGEKLTLTI